MRDLLPGLREELALDFVVANGENAAGGIGITPKEADELFGAGVDVITLGNHTYRHREVWPYLDQQPNILRPANFLPTQPGHGTTVVERDGTSLGVVNLSGNLYMQAGSPALVTIDEALREVADADLVLVDMHAEATSEKVALGWHLDGRVTAVVGTHTHVPTADARVLPGRHRLHHRRRDDRRARRRDRRAPRAVDRGHAQPHAAALRRRRRGPVAERRADPRERPPRRRDRAGAQTWKCSMIIGTMSRSAHCSRSSAESGPVPHQISEPSESLACSEPCEPPPTWWAPPQSRNS